MLQNFNILAGAVPVKRGNANRDLEAVIRYLGRAARACEANFDQLDREQENLGTALKNLEEENKKLRGTVDELRKKVEKLEQATSNSL